MIVYWVAVIETLLYACAVPLHIAVCLKAGQGLKASAGFALFEKRFAESRAAKRLSGCGRSGRGDGRTRIPGSIRFLLRMLAPLRRSRIRVTGCVSAGDAAGTALFIGGIRAAECTLIPFFPELSFNIVPDFNASISYVDIDGMITLRSGQIIVAALSAALKNTSRRITQWISIRSKVS